MEQEVVLYTYLFKQKGNRTLTLLDGQVVKAGAKFQAPAEAIPEGFKDLVEVVSEGKKAPRGVIVDDTAVKEREATITLREKELNEKAVELAEKEEALDTREEELIEREQALVLALEEIENVGTEGKEKKETKEVYTLKHISRGKWNILNAEGEPVLEENVIKAVAEEELEKLTK